MAPEWIINLCEKYQGQVTSGTNVIGQRAAVVALESSLEPTYEMVKIFKKKRFSPSFVSKTRTKSKIKYTRRGILSLS